MSFHHYCIFFLGPGLVRHWIILKINQKSRCTIDAYTLKFSKLQNCVRKHTNKLCSPLLRGESVSLFTLPFIHSWREDQFFGFSFIMVEGCETWQFTCPLLHLLFPLEKLGPVIKEHYQESPYSLSCSFLVSIAPSPFHYCCLRPTCYRLGQLDSKHVIDLWS
jgi:hypothetical protein